MTETKPDFWGLIRSLEAEGGYPEMSHQTPLFEAFKRLPEDPDVRQAAAARWARLPGMRLDGFELWIPPTLTFPNPKALPGSGEYVPAPWDQDLRLCTGLRVKVDPEAIYCPSRHVLCRLGDDRVRWHINAPRPSLKSVMGTFMPPEGVGFYEGASAFAWQKFVGFSVKADLLDVLPLYPLEVRTRVMGGFRVMPLIRSAHADSPWMTHHFDWTRHLALPLLECVCGDQELDFKWRSKLSIYRRIARQWAG